MTEFSISIREIQEKYKIMDLQQRKCCCWHDTVAGMILAPLAGIILNLFDAIMNTKHNDIVGIFASIDCPDTVLCGFQYLLRKTIGLSNRTLKDIATQNAKQLKGLVKRCKHNMVYKDSREYSTLLQAFSLKFLTSLVNLNLMKWHSLTMVGGNGANGGWSKETKH